MKAKEREELSRIPLGLQPAKLVQHTRICPQCNEERLVTEFEGLPVDKRCRECIPPYELPTLRERKLAAASTAFQNIIAKTRGKEPKIPHLNQLLAGLFNKWGGVEPFVSQYYSIIQQLAERSPSSAANHFKEIFKLFRDASKMQQVDDINQMNEAQTRREMQLGAFEIMAKLTVDQAHKELLMRVLENSGLLEEDAPDVLEHA